SDRVRSRLFGLSAKDVCPHRSQLLRDLERRTGIEIELASRPFGVFSGRFFNAELRAVARQVFPFLFGGQSIGLSGLRREPIAISFGIHPSHVEDRLLRKVGRRSPAVPVTRRRVSGLLYKFRVLPIGSQKLRYLKRSNFHLMFGSSVRVSLVGAHCVLRAFNENHMREGRFWNLASGSRSRVARKFRIEQPSGSSAADENRGKNNRQDHALLPA